MLVEIQEQHDNLNDVLATYEFYKKTVQLGKIELRKDIIRKYNLPCLNWNNGKIGENLILKLYCDKLGLNQWDVRKQRSPFLDISLKDCIPNNVIFKSELFKKVYEAFSNKIVTKNNFTDKDSKGKNRVLSILVGNCRIDYGLGGVHGVTKSGIYESNDKYIIKTADVASLYPNLPITNNFWISHLGEEFLNVYKNNIVDVRLAEKAKPKKEQDKSIIDGFKEACNIPYGKSNDENSFLYDPLYTMKTTVAGQLLLSMLVEQLLEIPECELLMFNTDGLEVKIPVEHEALYFSICKKWEQSTSLILEFDTYSKMWIADVNNYGCITTEGKIKNKGRLEVDKVIGSEPAYHKDNSFRIVPIALQLFFTENIPIEQTIKNHLSSGDYKGIKNYGIYDFCGRQKFGKDSYGETHTIELEDNKILIEKQQKNVRYYISNKGSSFIKRYIKGTSEVINKNYLVTIFNKYIEKEDYDINYDFYIREAYKEINTIINHQLTLF